MLLHALRLIVIAAAMLAGDAGARASEKVDYAGKASVGTVVVQTSERSLYFVTGKGQALKYPVGVGRSGQQWNSTSRATQARISWRLWKSISPNR